MSKILVALAIVLSIATISCAALDQVTDRVETVTGRSDAPEPTKSRPGELPVLNDSGNLRLPMRKASEAVTGQRREGPSRGEFLALRLKVEALEKALATEVKRRKNGDYTPLFDYKYAAANHTHYSPPSYNYSCDCNRGY